MSLDLVHPPVDPFTAATRQIGEMARRIEELMAELARATELLASARSQAEHHLHEKLAAEALLIPALHIEADYVATKVELEREACARIAEEPIWIAEGPIGNVIAEQIRARGNK